MNDKLRIGDPIDTNGKIRPIHDTSRAMHPVVAYTVTLEDGIYTFMEHECVRRDSVSETMSYIERRAG